MLGLAVKIFCWHITIVGCILFTFVWQIQNKNAMLTQDEAEKILAMPKVIIDNKGNALNTYVLDFASMCDYRLSLSASDSIDKNEDYLLRIHVSGKLRTRISLHTQENNTHYCIFRLDFNGAPHKNPEHINGNVPDKLKSFAGMKIDSNHIHYHVYGYPSAAWALPVENDSFPVKSLTIENYSDELKNILLSFSEVIHLESKLILTSRMLPDEMD